MERLLRCETVSDLNELVRTDQIRRLIRINEALHEKQFSQAADRACSKNARVVLLSGPSASGKTTAANRLAVQLLARGKKPVLLSMDDYYTDRDKILPGVDGKLDLEHINTIDTALFSENLQILLAGEQVEIPSFNFKTGKREWNGRFLQLQADSVIIVEGLHALNPVLLPRVTDSGQVFRLYVCPQPPLRLEDNWIPASCLRLLRRIVRDYKSRGTSVGRTIAMWNSVRRGEKRWIFPYQKYADIVIDSATQYELAVLKKHIFPLLAAVQTENEGCGMLRAMLKLLGNVQEADVDDEIPPTSLVREFIGGNTFYR